MSVHIPRRLAMHLPIIIVGIVVGIYYTLWRPSRDSLLVYCTHDAVFAEPVFDAFTRATGIRVVPVFDTEATKSLGLQERLIREGAGSPCDVFWNNEMLGTLDLAERGLLAEHRGKGWDRTPEAFRDSQGRWTGFGARLRVWIRRSDDPSPPVGESERLWDNPDLSGFAIAKPLYGTTLTQATVLWHCWGQARFAAWMADARRRGMRILDGNGAVARAVAAGSCRAGYTDTDDGFGQIDAGAGVLIEPVLIEGKAIAIPNTVAIMAGSRRRAAAETLVEFLLADQAQALLAASAGQIPLVTLGSPLPGRVAALVDAARQGWDLRDCLVSRSACLAWLKEQADR